MTALLEYLNLSAVSYGHMLIVTQTNNLITNTNCVITITCKLLNYLQNKKEFAVSTIRTRTAKMVLAIRIKVV